MSPIKAVAIRAGNVPAKIKKQLANAERRAKSIEVRDERGESRAVQFAVEVRTVVKAVAEAERSQVAPLDVKKKAIKELFAPLRVKLAGIDAELNAKLGEYRTNIAAKQDRKIEQVMEKVDNGDITMEKGLKVIARAESAVGPVKAAGGRIQYREELVVSAIDASKLPREFMIPDVSKINAAIKGGKNIAGVTVEVKQIPMVYVTQG